MDDDEEESKESNSDKLVDTIASYNYSAVLNAAGEVYTWGAGEFGRLGCVDMKRQVVPRLLHELFPNTVKKIALGYYHAAAVN